MAAEFKTAQPLEYYRKFLEESIRPDGRETTQFRNTAINIGSISTAEGSSIVKLGNTTVMCGVKAELANPSSEHPKRGFLVPNLDLPPLCASWFRPGPPSEQAQVLSQFIADTIKTSEMIDLESLCIFEDQLVWCLYIDLVCLNYDGNIVDASMAAFLAAIRNIFPVGDILPLSLTSYLAERNPKARLPEVTINEETGSPEPSAPKDIPLDIKEHPIASTFAVFDHSTILADPTDEEEKLATGVITIVVSSEGKLCSVYKPGGSPMSSKVLIEQCTKEARKHAKCVQKLIDAAM